MSRSVVVLPEPEGASMVKNSPGATARSTPSTAATFPYALRNPVRRTSGAPGSAPFASRDCDVAGVDNWGGTLNALAVDGGATLRPAAWPYRRAKTRFL